MSDRPSLVDEMRANVRAMLGLGPTQTARGKGQPAQSLDHAIMPTTTKVTCPTCEGLGQVLRVVKRATVGQRFREIRGGMLQEDMARMLGIGRSALSQIESDSLPPPVSAVVLIARFHHCSTDYALGLTNDLGRDNHIRF